MLDAQTHGLTMTDRKYAWHPLKKEIGELRVGLAGSPGTGKKSVGKELSKLTGLDFVSLNEIAIKRKIGRRSNGEFVVDIQKLRKLRIDTRGRIISGHLLPYVIPTDRLDFVAILRCSPRVLRRRYLARGYSMRKTEENVEAELLDIVSFKCLESYGRRKVAEFDTTRIRNPETVAKRIMDTLKRKIPRRYGVASWSLMASRSPKSLRKLLQY
ncbi:MAG: adenylate kinase family protein [Nitrososphaerales archaeon]